MSELPIKYAILGLDNAGKTSILHILQHIYGFEEDIRQLKPTIRIRYTQLKILNRSDVYFWDYGGQASFREDYLKDHKYFENISIFLYLIDVQDELRFSQNVEYLGRILNLIGTESTVNFSKINICFSKSDPDFINSNPHDYSARIEMLKGFFSAAFPKLKIEYYNISIYDIYSILHLILATLNDKMTVLQKLNPYLNDYALATGGLISLLFDSSALLVSEVHGRTIKENESEPLQIQQIINARIRIFKHIEENNLQIGKTSDTTSDLLIESIPLRIEPKDQPSQAFYLLNFYRNPPPIKNEAVMKEKLDALMNYLENLLQR
jgi:hypothetical protein